MRVIEKFVAFLTDQVSNILSFMMTHILSSALVCLGWLCFIGFVTYKAGRSPVFGYWWRLDNRLNHFANICFIVFTIIFTLILFYLLYLWKIQTAELE